MWLSWGLTIFYPYFFCQEGDGECLLTITRVSAADLGVWTCKAMVWDEWGEGQVRGVHTNLAHNKTKQ